MPEHSPAPRRHRSSFRAPAPESVDAAALSRVFGDDAFEEPAAARADESSTHDDGRARHRRVADRAAEHLAARMARANSHVGHRPAEAPTDAATEQFPLGERVERPALAAPQTDAAPTEGGFDELITPRMFDAPDFPAAAPARHVAPVHDRTPAGTAATELSLPATEPIAISEIPSPDVTRELEATRPEPAYEPGARDLLAALDPEGLLDSDAVTEPGTRSISRAARASAPARRDSAPARPRFRAGRRTIFVAAAAAALLVAGGLGAVIATGAGSPEPTSPGATSSSESRDAVEASPTATITGELSETAAPITGGTSVSVAGEHLDEVTRVSVGGAEAAIVDATADRLTFTVPPAADDAPGEVPVVFSDAQGNPAAAGAGSLTLTYTPDSGVDAQLAYVSEHWNAYNPDYPTLPGQDSVNFASQSLVARGWSMDDVWNADGETGTMSAAWSGATALRDYLRTRTDRATELTDAQRDEVKPGDIAQFDWDDSGDRDFTAVVTRVEHTDAGTKVWITAHSNDVESWDVDSALASGGTVSYFSIR